MADTALARRETVAELVRAYEESERDIREGFARIQGAQRRLGIAFGSTPTIRTGRNDPAFDFGDPERSLVAVRRQCWEQLIARLELSKIMSIKRWEALWRQVHERPDKDVPEISLELVLGMAQNFRSQIDEMLREAVREVYEWLRPYRSEYKSNSEFQVGKRVVLGYMVEREWYGWRVCYTKSQHLSALERVFRMLDGHAPTSTDGRYYSEIETAIKAITPGDDCRGETLYFRFRGFQNRNLHIEFLRPDLVAALNRVAGGGMLPQKTGTKPRGRTAADVLHAAVERARHELTVTDANFFETPASLAIDAASRLELGEGLTLLEPSAGRGALLVAARQAAPGSAMTAVESDPAHLGELGRFAADVRHANFLSLTPEASFDRVLMNPPFSHHRDVLHVAHAFRFLKPGGVLVAIMSGGAVFREDKVSRAFRELVAENQGEIWNNDQRAFRESGTDVRTVMVRLRKAVS